MKRWLALIALLAVLPTCAQARSKIQGWCQDGNKTVTVPGATGPSTTTFQQSFSSCTVTVYQAGTVTVAAIYADDSGTVKANPFTSAATGQWFFYADDGGYDVKFSGSGIASPFTIGDNRLFDPSKVWTNVQATPYNAKGDGATCDDTAINSAITNGKKYILIPQGNYHICNTINFSGKEGIKFIGGGSGQTGASCGTVFTWAGAANGTVMSISQTRWSLFRDFCIDGASSAGKGIDLIGALGGTSNQLNIIENMAVLNVTGTPGYAIRVGNTDNPDVSQNELKKITVLGSKICLYQDGNQTVKNIYRGWTCNNSAGTYGMEFVDGDAEVYDSQFLSTSASAVADVYVSNTLLTALFQNNWHENNTGYTGTAYLFQNGTRTSATTMIGNRIKYDAGSGKIIDYQQGGPLTLLGNMAAGSGTATVNLNGAGGGPSHFILLGNTWNQPNFTVAFTGKTSVIEQDNASSIVGLYTEAIRANEARFEIDEPNPQILIKENDQVANTTTWAIQANGGSLSIGACSDALSCTAAETITRSTSSPVNANFTVPITSTPVTFSNGAATPSVAGGNVFKTANGAPTSITDFTNGVTGQVIYIVFGDGSTTVVNAGNLKLQGVGNYTATLYDTLTLVNIAGTWYEIARSVNG